MSEFMGWLVWTILTVFFTLAMSWDSIEQGLNAKSVTRKCELSLPRNQHCQLKAEPAPLEQLK